MKSKWNKSWVGSIQPRKQRKYRHNAPLHIKHKLLAGHLSKELRKKYKRRAFPLRKNDKVKILRGKFKGVIGEIEEVDMKKTRVYIKGAEIKKEEGRAIKYPIQPSNVIILELSLDDKKRKASLEKNLSEKEKQERLDKKEQKKAEKQEKEAVKKDKKEHAEAKRAEAKEMKEKEK